MAIDIELDAIAPELVISGYFEAGAPWLVHVGHTLPYLSPEEADSVFVDNAQLTISTGGTPVDTLLHQGDGWYLGQGAGPLPDGRYTLHGSAPGYPEIEATDGVPSAFEGEVISVEMFESTRGSLSVQLRVRIDDPPDEANYYQLRFMYENPNLFGDERFPVFFQFEDPTLILDSHSTSNQITFSDLLFDGKSVELNFDMSVGQRFPDDPGPLRLYTELSTVNDVVFSLEASIESQRDTDDNPFAEPVPVYSNVEGGVGIFTGRNTTRGQYDFFFD